ncbi:hypothetical protein TREMEDRAFT_70376 [Tremella mesenterica DSM 1558]|uniref:uncharacterized protein n=1 Tax=Tremella mesenterica (strain ATCC 24925 / CBS 8224 / DSM 1558 / NBRC 9311 / NRRL Y-6157 / RJB 2259-6 / UBC 559-6) TaxID=578456 RepID=UPI00032D3F41|nr:uncharacterized protein TREMEDRAFT_70376 [Tremella mesenterica DSM 1558]EIW65964.1 hypothetical protein TREMEDRAFT_70376 [Tremella mesenterica DSM 1558]
MSSPSHKSKSRTRKTTKRTPYGSTSSEESTGAWKWWIILPVVTILPYLFSKAHYNLPDPVSPYDPSGLPQVSEDLVMGHIAALEQIGYRIVGTQEALDGEKYVLDQVKILEGNCNDGGVLKCEVWVQKGSGFHEFELLDHEILKVYKGITNIILRITSLFPPSGPRDPEAKDAILLGSHIDSTLPSPGAADDGMGVGVMLDVARVLVERNAPFDNSIIFLWNGGEETLQDGSHLYSTQHETRHSVKAMINLEAAGTTGGALLFQATSAELIEAYSRAPHPRGTVIAADVFASGIILSDTDFGQFEQYLNVPGLDVSRPFQTADNSDSIVNIETGAAQHFADNIIAIVDYLLSPNSPLPHTLSPPHTVYLSLYDRFFFHCTMPTAGIVYFTMATMVLAVIIVDLRQSAIRPFLIALIGTPVGLIAGLIPAILLALSLSSIGKGQLWFRHEHLSLVLYCPIAYLGSLLCQYFLSTFLPPSQRHRMESATYHAQLVWYTTLMLLIHNLGIRSAYIFTFLVTPQLLATSWKMFRQLINPKGARELGAIGGYVLPLAVLMFLCVEAITSTLDIFTPLSGRMGKDAPAEIIIATISASCGLVFFPPVVPLFHRLPRKQQRRTIMGLTVLTLGVIGFMTSPMWGPYDKMHPKRGAVQYTHNHTDHTDTLHLAYMDRGYSHFHIALHDQFAPESNMTHTSLTPYDPDWDVLYPVSTFLDTYRFEIPGQEFSWPDLRWSMKEVSRTGDERRVRLTFDFTGLLWPTIAFEAEILDWNFEFPPPKGIKRHHFKIATSLDDAIVELELGIPLEKVIMDWSAIDMNQMVPNTAPRLGPNMPASKLLTEIDSWAQNAFSGSIDLLMFGAVVGSIEV